METILTGMAERLFGNHQPGELDKMRAEIKEVRVNMDAVEQRAEVRLTELEHWLYKAMGAGSVVMFLLAVFEAWHAAVHK